MIDTAWLLETFDLCCGVCGKRGADSFGDPAALERVLTVRPPLTPVPQIMAPFGIGRIQAADLEAGRPVHLRCLPGDRGRLMRSIGFGREG